MCFGLTSWRETTLGKSMFKRSSSPKWGDQGESRSGAKETKGTKWVETTAKSINLPWPWLQVPVTPDGKTKRPPFSNEARLE